MDRAVEIAWAAGLFEGEGCFTIWNRTTGWVNPGIQLSTTDLDVIERFASIVGMGRVYSARKPTVSGKTMYHWVAAGHESLIALLEMFGPHLGARRRARAAEILTLRREWEESRVAQVTCEWCGKTESVSHHNSARRRFCSKKCRDAASYRRRPVGT